MAAFHDCCVRHPGKRVPHSCVLCKGGLRCCMRYLMGYDAQWINKLAPAFPTPAPSQNAKNGARTLLVMPARSKPGHPADSSCSGREKRIIRWPEIPIGNSALNFNLN